MTRRTLNLGILAHVDAGKTTLTERLLHASGAIDVVGSVDSGTTQTDTLALERQRGITIRSAVATLVIDGVTVNLIDTPGHPDFIAEVERVLSVLDGAVLVVSAVEGVQPQTRVLMAALERLRVPTIVFVNKVDRVGADVPRVIEEIERRLGLEVIALSRVRGGGRGDVEATLLVGQDASLTTRLTDVLTTHDDDLLRDVVEHAELVDDSRLLHDLADQTARCLVHPVYAGSAATGAGVGDLLTGLVRLLPTEPGDPEAPAWGRVFKIERSVGGGRVAYVRLFAGTIRPREHLRVGDADEKVRSVKLFDRGGWVTVEAVRAGEVAQVTGLAAVRVGDVVGGTGPDAGAAAQFPPPTLETVVDPRSPRQRGSLRAALSQLAEQDPLINVRQDDVRHEFTVSLYGEVQKEVIGATLADEYGIEVEFRESMVVCTERLRRPGEAVERLHGETNPFNAWLGLRVEPLAPGSGVQVRLEIEPTDAPLYLFKSLPGFAAALEEWVAETLAEGLHGWQVADLLVTVTECVYASWDGPPSTRGPLSSAADFRRLTALVLMRAVADAGTVVCEPVLAVRLDVPSPSSGPVVGTLARIGGRVRGQFTAGDESVIEADVPATRLRELQRLLPGLTGGEPQLRSGFSHYAPVAGPPPIRRRIPPNPLNLEEYVAAVGRSG